MSGKRKKVKTGKRARPGRRPRLSLCIIARDEETVIGKCLDSVRGVADEIIVVDTGSEDRTVEIAASHGAKIIKYPWNDDFSAARNIGLEQARGEWILVLDADEQLVAEDIPRLRSALKTAQGKAFFLTMVNLEGETERGALEHSFPTVRLFRNIPGHRFTGRIHETVSPAGPKAFAEAIEVRIKHFGQLGDVVSNKRKGERNLRLLDIAARENGDPAQQRFLEANELLVADRFAEALKLYEELFPKLRDEQAPNCSGVLLDIVQCLDGLNRVEDSRKWLERGLALFPDYTDLEYLRGLSYLNTAEYEAAIKSFQTVLAMGEAPAIYRKKPGIATWGAWEGIGLTRLRQGQFDRALEAFRKALKIYPGHAQAVFNIGAIQLQAGRPSGEVWRELESSADGNSPEVQQVMQKLGEIFGPRP